LISYGLSSIDPYHLAANCFDRILKGENPGDLPVRAPAKDQIVIHLEVAEALGITFPFTMVGRADE
jgi:putative ABC transport system substrate-binding protein